MRLGKIAVAWCGGLLALFGVLYLVSTQQMLGYAEITNPTPTALTDLRVMYGGLQVALGIFILASLRRDSWLEPALGLAAITFACVPAVRLLGMAREGTFNEYHVSALVIEIATLAFASFAWRGVRAA